MTVTDADRDVLLACFEAARAHPFYRDVYRDCSGIDDASAIDKRADLAVADRPQIERRSQGNASAAASSQASVAATFSMR